MDQWAEFYERIFNFREIRYFDIEGKLTGLMRKAMTSPDGKIRIPINESPDDKSQIEEFLTDYHGEGIQHIALGTRDIFAAVETLRDQGVTFQDMPDTYYERLDARLPGHGENLQRLPADRILIDGAPTKGGGLLLQIFTENVIGPIFFEIIQRKGNEGFGEGNFRALFESIELDQIRRGVLQAEGKGGNHGQELDPVAPVEGTPRARRTPTCRRAPSSGRSARRASSARGALPPPPAHRLGGVRGALRPRAFDLSKLAAAGLAVGRPAGAGQPASADALLEARQADARAGPQQRRRQLLFVHEGEGDLFCDFGHSTIATATTSCSRAARCGGSRLTSPRWR